MTVNLRGLWPQVPEVPRELAGEAELGVGAADGTE